MFGTGRRDAEQRDFMREILLRNEKVWRSVVDVLDRNTRELTELRDQTRAHTDALLRVLDRLERGEGGTAT